MVCFKSSSIRLYHTEAWMKNSKQIPSWISSLTLLFSHDFFIPALDWNWKSVLSSFQALSFLSKFVSCLEAKHPPASPLLLLECWRGVLRKNAINLTWNVTLSALVLLCLYCKVFTMNSMKRNPAANVLRLRDVGRLHCDTSYRK